MIAFLQWAIQIAGHAIELLAKIAVGAQIVKKIRDEWGDDGEGGLVLVPA